MHVDVFLKVDYFYLLFQNYNRSEGFYSDTQHFAYKLSPVTIYLRNPINPIFPKWKNKKVQLTLKKILKVAFRKRIVFFKTT